MAAANMRTKAVAAQRGRRPDTPRLRERVSAGGTVIMTTHILEVAERMADRIGVIAGGRLIAEGTLDDLRRQTGKTATSLEDTFLALVAEEVAAA